MGLKYLHVVLLLLCRSSLCVHPENGLLLWCFYWASLWLQRLLGWGRLWATRICSIFLLWMKSKALVNSTNNIVACKIFAFTPSKKSTDSQNLLGRGSISSEAILDFFFLQSHGKQYGGRKDMRINPLTA